VFAATPVTPQLLTEDEVATLLASDSDLLGRVDRGLEFILNRNLVVFTPPTTASFYLQSRNRETGTTAELVNEGFGTNQLAFLLAKIHKEGNELVCIEEPEIHLHPAAIAKFVEHLVRTTQQPLSILRRQFIISTHSEHFIASLLGLVAQRRLRHTDIALFYATRRDYETFFERCEVSENGQVKGGLRGFYEAELEAVRNLLQPPERG
jgi:predicted ATPase